jgi:AraC family transcriptional activator of tynA and feaB
LPYGCTFRSDSNMLVVKVPRRELEARLGQTREMVLCPIKRSGPEGELTSSLMAMLPPYIGRMRPAIEEIVKDQVLDLFALSLAQAMGTQRPNVSSARSLAVMRLRAVIEARLSDRSLTAGSVAAAARISVRYANSLLAREGTSIMRLIQTRRLERCRKSLEDPLQAHRTLTEIAYCWGFSDMTHFGRRFKATYGMSPGGYRIVAKNAGFFRAEARG